MNSFPYILTQRLMLEKLRLGVNVDISNVHTMKKTLSSLRIASNQGVNAGKVYIPEVFIRGISWSKQNQRILEYLASSKIFQHLRPILVFLTLSFVLKYYGNYS